MLRDVEVTPDERDQAVWGDIAQAFSKPLTRDDTLEEYWATQVLWERFKSEGYDGVAHKSHRGRARMSPCLTWTQQTRSTGHCTRRNLCRIPSSRPTTR